MAAFAATSIAVTIRCNLCGGPFTVNVPMHTEAVDGWLRVVVDHEHLTTAVRMHHRQHQN